MSTCPTHLIHLDLITCIIFDEEYESYSSSLHKFLHSPDTSSLWPKYLPQHHVYIHQQLKAVINPTCENERKQPAKSFSCGNISIHISSQRATGIVSGTDNNSPMHSLQFYNSCSWHALSAHTAKQHLQLVNYIQWKSNISLTKTLIHHIVTLFFSLVVYWKYYTLKMLFRRTTDMHIKWGL